MSTGCIYIDGQGYATTTDKGVILNVATTTFTDSNTVSCDWYYDNSGFPILSVLAEPESELVSLPSHKHDWRCWFCGSENEDADHKCNHCNAPKRLAA